VSRVSQEFNAIAKAKQQQQQRQQQQGQADPYSGLAVSGSNPLLQQLLQKRSRGADGREGDAEEDGDLDGEEQPDAANTFLVRGPARGHRLQRRHRRASSRWCLRSTAEQNHAAHTAGQASAAMRTDAECAWMLAFHRTKQRLWATR